MRECNGFRKSERAVSLLKSKVSLLSKHLTTTLFFQSNAIYFQIPISTSFDEVNHKSWYSLLTHIITVQYRK